MLLYGMCPCPPGESAIKGGRGGQEGVPAIFCTIMRHFVVLYAVILLLLISTIPTASASVRVKRQYYGMYGMYPYGGGLYNPYTFNYPLYGYQYRNGLGGFGYGMNGLYGMNGMYGLGGLGGYGGLGGLGYGLYGK